MNAILEVVDRRPYEEEVWQPDVTMPVPFTDLEVEVVQRYAAGQTLRGIAETLDYSYGYLRNRFFYYTDEYHGISTTGKILEYYRQNGICWHPNSIFGITIWMQAHRFLTKIKPADPGSLDPSVRFTQHEIRLMSALLSGIDPNAVAKTANMGLKTLNMAVNGDDVFSMAARVRRAVPGSSRPAHRLAIGFRMVAMGLIDEDIIGSRLPPLS